MDTDKLKAITTYDRWIQHPKFPHLLKRNNADRMTLSDSASWDYIIPLWAKCHAEFNSYYENLEHDDFDLLLKKQGFENSFQYSGINLGDLASAIDSLHDYILSLQEHQNCIHEREAKN